LRLYQNLKERMRREAPGNNDARENYAGATGKRAGHKSKERRARLQSPLADARDD